MATDAGVQRIRSRSGGFLTVVTSGTPTGIPVVLHHGTPGSHSGPKPRTSVLYRLGVRLITYDRPGYGDSTRHEGRLVADAAWDVESIVDALGVGRFAVVGRSGGAPHALACAALLGDRVVRTTVLVSLAPRGAVDFDWQAGMNDSNVSEYSAGVSDHEMLIETIRSRVHDVNLNPNIMIEQLLADMTEADRQVVDDPTMRQLLAANYREALKNGPFGWYDDVLALGRDWGFDPADIRTPVQLWHGAKDNFAPVSHTEWLAARIANSRVVLEPKAAHFGAIEMLPELLPWLISWKAATIAGSTVSASHQRTESATERSG